MFLPSKGSTKRNNKPLGRNLRVIFWREASFAPLRAQTGCRARFSVIERGEMEKPPRLSTQRLFVYGYSNT